MSEITLDQLKRGVAAIDAHRDLLKAVHDAFLAAGEERVDSLGGVGLMAELTRQLEERCNDPKQRLGGSMIEYMLYEGRSHGGRCTTNEGQTIEVNSPEALWEWWRLTSSGPFTATTVKS